MFLLWVVTLLWLGSPSRVNFTWREPWVTWLCWGPYWQATMGMIGMLQCLCAVTLWRILLCCDDNCLCPCCSQRSTFQHIVCILDLRIYTKTGIKLLTEMPDCSMFNVEQHDWWPVYGWIHQEWLNPWNAWAEGLTTCTPAYFWTSRLDAWPSCQLICIGILHLLIKTPVDLYSRCLDTVEIADCVVAALYYCQKETQSSKVDSSLFGNHFSLF